MKKKSREWKEADWNHLIGQIKKFTFHITRCRGYEQAQVCTGGVPLAELKNCSMESAKVPGLYLCGELLDVDGACGGYNLQWAGPAVILQEMLQEVRSSRCLEFNS